MNLSLPLSYTHKHNPSVSAQKAVHKNTKSQELKKCDAVFCTWIVRGMVSM